jgi:hypothetical protein
MVPDDRDSKRRRIPLCLVALPVAALLPAGLLAWSCYSPVSLPIGDHLLAFGAFRVDRRFVRGPIGIQRSKNDDWAIAIAGPEKSNFIVAWFFDAK